MRWRRGENFADQYRRANVSKKRQESKRSVQCGGLAEVEYSERRRRMEQAWFDSTIEPDGGAGAPYQ